MSLEVRLLRLHCDDRGIELLMILAVWIVIGPIASWP